MANGRGKSWGWLVAAVAMVSVTPAFGAGSAAQDSKVSEVAVLCPSSDPQAVELYNAALKRQTEGGLAEAQALYRQAIARDARYCDAMDNLGQLLRRTGELDEAVTWYRRSIAVKPDNQAAHQNLAVAYKFQKNFDAARAEYRWLIENAPSNPEGYYGMGTLLLEEGEADAAIGSLQGAEKLYLAAGSPYVGDARFALGIAYFEKNDCVRAREYLLLCYQEREGDARENYMLGVCYLDPATGDKKKAAEFLSKAKSLGATIPPEVASRLAQ